VVVASIVVQSTKSFVVQPWSLDRTLNVVSEVLKPLSLTMRSTHVCTLKPFSTIAVSSLLPMESRNCHSIGQIALAPVLLVHQMYLFFTTFPIAVS